MNDYNRKHCKELDVGYKSCQDCKWFAGVADSIDDDGEDWVSTRGVCITGSAGTLNKFTYVPGDVIVVDADEEACPDFDEVKDTRDNNKFAEQFPGYWRGSDTINKKSFEDLYDNPAQLMAWLYDNLSWDTKFKVMVVDHNYYVKPGFVGTLSRFREILVDTAIRKKWDKVWIENIKRIDNCVKFIPILTKHLGISLIGLFNKDGEEYQINADIFIDH